MAYYWHEFITLTLIHILAVISPGPDLAVVTTNSIRFGRRAGILTALGIGFGISIHVMYSLAGLRLLQQSPTLFDAVRLLGGVYILYLAWKLLHAQRYTTDITQVPVNNKKTQWLWQGFLTNVLNPKAALFFIAVFTSLVSPTTPVGLKVFYGFWLCLTTALWFSFVSLFFSQPRIRHYFLSFGHWFERIMGALLIAVASYVFYNVFM